MNTKAIRVLNLLGGGARGYLALLLLRAIISQSRLTYQEFFSLFDAISGTSIGGIMALGFAFGLAPDEMEDFFLNYGKRIFSIDKNDNTRPTMISKITDAVAGVPFYESPDDYASLAPGEKYGHQVLVDLLSSKFGNATISSITKNKVIVPAIRTDNTEFVMFSNLTDNQYFTNSNDKLSDIALATSAAPFYLPSPTFGTHTYWDGGPYANDPCEAGILAAKIAKPIHDSIIVFSITTGLGYWGFNQNSNVSIGSSVLGKTEALLFASMVGSEQYTNWKLALQNDRTLTPIYTDNYLSYTSINPVFQSELDDFSPATMALMKTTADKYISDNSAMISNAIGHLLA